MGQVGLARMLDATGPFSHMPGRFHMLGRHVKSPALWPGFICSRDPKNIVKKTIQKISPCPQKFRNLLQGEIERPEMETAAREGLSLGARERRPTSSAARLPVAWWLLPPEAIVGGGGREGSCGIRGACPRSWFSSFVSFLAER
jgi:hypothetical protein